MNLIRLIQSAIINYFSCKWAVDKPAATMHQLRMVVSFSTIGMFVLFIVGFINVFTGEYLLGSIDLVFFLLLIFINIYLRKSYNVKLGVIACTILYFIFSIYLILQETVTYSGIMLWLFIYPPIAIFFSSKKIGLRLSLICWLVIAFVLFDERLFNILPTAYGVHYSIRFLLVYLVFTFFAYSYEIVRLKLEKELRITNEKLANMALTDHLTGISNRRDIMEKIEYERFCSLRNKSRFSIVIGDVDFFKNINDQYGHNCGDVILKKLAKLITASLRKQDRTGRIEKNLDNSVFIPSRWGGEEFLILLPETNLKGASIVAEKLRKKIECYIFTCNEIIHRITMSFGISEFRNTEDINKCISRADQKLYESKRNGRNKVSF